MVTTTERILFWTPRALMMVFAAFLGIFALGAFDGPVGPGETMVALAMHLLPVVCVLLALRLAWLREFAGGLLVAGLGIAYCVWAWGHFPFVTYAAIAGPPIVAGLLFIVHDRMTAPSVRHGT